MKTKWHLFILWSLLFLGLLHSEKTHESPSTRRRKAVERRRASAAGNATTGLRWSAAPPGPPRSTRTGEPGAQIQADSAHPPDVSVSCSASDFVVRVRPGFYGLGANAEELKLGSGCKSNGVLRPSGDLLFTYPLTACDGLRQLPPGYLVYKFVLHYEPSPARFPSRARRLRVDVECHYPRDHHVHQLAVQPTWETVVVRKRLKGRPNDFEIHLMDDSWSSPAKSVYQLGETINVRVSAPHLTPGRKLYVSSCYAAPSSGFASSLKYSVIDNFGCMLDSKQDPGAWQFISRTDQTLSLSLKAFQFTADPDTEVGIHCKVSVTSQEPGPAHKSCTYKDNRWRALSGRDSICDCCESSCAASKTRRAPVEGSASSRPLVVSDQPHLAAEGFLPVNVRPPDQAEINQHAEGLQNHWENGGDQLYEEDEEEGEESESEPDLESGWGDYEVEGLYEFEEEGSAYEEVDFSEGGVENTLERGSETLQSWMREGNDTDGGRSEESERRGAAEQRRRSSSVGEGRGEEEEETTWYFTWS